MGCVDSFGTAVEGSIASFFKKIGNFVGAKPVRTIALALGITLLCGVGFMRWETENRPEELWVPQNTIAETETERYEEYFAGTSRFNLMIIESSTDDANVLTKDSLMDAMKAHTEIATKSATVEGEMYVLTDICVKSGGTCVSSFEGACSCLITSVLKQWNYNMTLLEADEDVLATINQYGSREDLEGVLGNAIFDSNDELLSAEAFTLSYFLVDQSVVVDGSLSDPVGEGWELDVFLAVAESFPTAYPSLETSYFATRSFGDEFGEAITGDLLLVNISYVIAFLFLAATMGKIVCGPGSRWTLALGALVAVGLSTAAGFGVSSGIGLFFGPVHSLLPFILLGIGVDDAFVIVNAFNRERSVKRADEDNAGIAARAGRALARAGASITVTSATDLVAFAISSSSRLPALASFCAYAAISIFFLWLFAATFFSSTMVLDERRQRDNRRECLCCVTRSKELEETTEGFEEGRISRYFRNYHAPFIFSPFGKVAVLAFFGALIGFGFYGALNLTVEDTTREFIPDSSYLIDYFEATDEYFPSSGITLFITFENSTEIYENRVELAALEDRVSGLSDEPPYIAEPTSEDTYRNAMDGLGTYLASSGTGAIGGVAVGEDGWPTSEEDFLLTLANYASFDGPGAQYARDLAWNEDQTELYAYRVELEYIRLTKEIRGETKDDADRQIAAMDATREMIAGWTDLQPAFPYSEFFIGIEGFKIIRRELFTNVGLAIAAVGLIILITVASPVTAFLITISVAFCIIEILGFMFALGIVIDSVSVINIVLAVGLSVDYSAHVGHCFMTKGGNDKNARATESLADIGSAVLQGGVSTFLAVLVLLFSSSYVFVTLSRQFALTVGLGLLHGLVLLPVLLSLLGPKPFASAEPIAADDFTPGKEDPPIGETGDAENISDDDKVQEEEDEEDAEVSA